MNADISKTNLGADYFNARLDEVGLSAYERMRAKAELARAEVLASAIVEIISLVKRLLKTLLVRPYQRLSANLG